MSIYYVRNSNGKYYSTDRKIRYIKLTGKEAFDYLHKSEGWSKTFIRANDENEAEGIFVETDSALVTALYLQEKPMSEKEYAETLGVSQQAISKQKLNVLRKLKKYF